MSFSPFLVLASSAHALATPGISDTATAIDPEKLPLPTLYDWLSILIGCLFAYCATILAKKIGQSLVSGVMTAMFSYIALVTVKDQNKSPGIFWT